MTAYAETLQKYQSLNEKAARNGVVFFGGDWLYDFPIDELAERENLTAGVYNRSLKGLSLQDTDKVLDICVCDLHPDKLFIHIGENDLEKFDAEAFAEKYEWLLYTIHSRSGCSIYLLSVIGDHTDEVNDILKGIAEKYNCEYIDIRNISLWKIFSKIKMFLRNHPITFCEAMSN